VGPVVAGWSVLAWESRTRVNASYDAYKILAVFLPCLLPGLLAGLAVARARRAGTVLGLLLAANLWVAFDFRRVMTEPPLRVDRRLAGLAGLEADPRVTSLNLRVEDFWSRLWANAFLLRKPQYFPTHTYEGRLNTELRGEWDLTDSPLVTVPLLAVDLIRVNEIFRVVRVAAPGRLEANFDRGWHPPEKDGLTRWRWSDGGGRLLIHNPTRHAVAARLRLGVRALRPGPLEVRLEQHSLGVRVLDGTVQELAFAHLLFQPGNTVMTLVAAPGTEPGDARPLAIALHAFELTAVGVR
jgi:hypothetical protein